MSVRTLSVGLRNTFYHNRRKWSFEIDAHVIFFNNSENFEHIDGIESDLGIFSFYRGNDTDISGSDFSISGGDFESGFASECDAGIVVILTTDEIRSFESNDKVVSHHDSFCRISFRKEVCVVWKMSIK